MFARLYTNNVDVKTAYSELSKVITGAITSPASLTAFNSSTSTIDATQPSNWAEYTTVGSTNNVNAGTAIWFRQRNRAGRWKYAAVYRTTSPTNTHKGLLRHYTVDAPSVLASVAGTATNNSEAYGGTTEYTVAAGPGYLVVATRLTTSTYFTEAHMWLEYPESENSAYFTLPNHVLYRHFTTGGSYATDATTDIAYSTGIVECAKPSGNADVQVLNGGMSAPATTHGTMKPSYFTSFTNTLDSSGNFVAYPYLSLFYESPYQGLLDCSSLTNVWGTGQALTTPNPAAPAGVSLLTAATGTFSDLSANSFAVTAVGNTIISDVTPFNAAVTWASYFDGNGDYLSIPDNSAFAFGAGSFTIEAWIRLTAYSSGFSGIYQSAILSQDDTTARAFELVLIGTAASWTQIAIGLFANNSTYLFTIANYSFSLSTWYHIACVRNGTSVRLYVNGTDIGGGTNSTTVQDVGGNIIVGGLSPSWAASGYGYYFPGYISNLRVVKGTALYTGSFTAPTASFSTSSLPSGTSLLTCNTSSFVDYSSNNFTITPAGNVVTAPTSLFMAPGWSNYFDGSGDYLTIPDNTAFNFGSGNFTVECWVRLVGTGNPERIVNYWSTATTSAASWEIAAASGNSIIFQASTNGVSSAVSLTKGSLSRNVWYHVAAVRSGNVFSLYVDGVLAQSTTQAITLQTANTITVASRRNGASYSEAFNGYISNLRVVKGTAFYTGNFATPTSPLPVSNFTNVYGDVITINGSDYAYLKANGSMSYLVPKR